MRLEGFVLAGGRSRRMGTDKARVPWPERWPMALTVVEALRPVCERVALVRRGRPERLPWIDRDGLPLEVIREGDGASAHPLAGVAAALRSCRTPLALLAPCDTPGVGEAVAALVAAGGPCVARAEGRVHPLVVILPVERAEQADALARAGAPARALVADLPTIEVPARSLQGIEAWDQTGAPSPLEALGATLAFLDPVARGRALDGERARLAARGAVAPER